MYKEYYPLPKYLTIKESKIHRLGLFTTEKIDKGVNLGKSHYATESEIIRTPLGGFVNHSNEPNIKIERMKKTRYFNIITLRVINPGEELTGKYMRGEKIVI